MAVIDSPIRLWEEIADLVASQPSPQQLLDYRPSPAVVERAQHLLHKSKREDLTDDEEHELDQFEQAELLMRLIKAQVRSKAS